MAHLNACAAQGLRLHGAANELGVRASTIKTAAYREGKLDWLQAKYPSAFQPEKSNNKIRDFEGPKIRTIKEIGGWPKAPDTPATRWLTRSWR